MMFLLALTREKLTRDLLVWIRVFKICQGKMMI